MSDTITLTLPYPPTANHLKYINRGVMRKSKEAKAYSLEVRQLATIARVQPLAGELLLSVRVFRPMRRGDLDNTLKACQDSLTGIAYQDDSQITRIEAERFDDKTNPRIEVTISRRLEPTT